MEKRTLGGGGSRIEMASETRIACRGAPFFGGDGVLVEIDLKLV